MDLDGSATHLGPAYHWVPNGNGRTEARDTSEDEYDAMEEWFSTSFPTVAVVPTQQQDTASEASGSFFSDKAEHSNAIRRMDEDKYEIDLGSRGLNSSCDDDHHLLVKSRDEDVEEKCDFAKLSSSWTNHLQPLVDGDTTEQEEEIVQDFQPKAFKRRQRSEAETRNGCSRCKSNLNGKLIVRCTTCAFRQHLYCFSPPLRQHPAFQQHHHITPKGTKVQIRPSADAIARWKCNDCQQKLCANQAQEEKRQLDLSHLPTSTSDKAFGVTAARANLKDHQRAKATSPKRQPTVELVNERTGSADEVLRPVQAKWVRNSQSDFDWYAFRADKVEKISSLEASTGKPDMLAYYSKPFAELKKKTSNWMERVAWKKSFRRQRELVETKMQLPPRRNVMHSLTDKELKLIEATLLRRQRDAEEELVLFDDAQTYQFDISASRIRFLRQPRLSIAVPTISTTFNEEPESNDEIALVLREMTEIVQLHGEDTNGSQPDESPTTPTQALIEAKLKWAAITIQSALVRWNHEARRRLKTKLQLELAANERVVRQKAAARSIGLLRSCVICVILFVRNLRNAQTKKQLLFALQEVSEDSKVAISAVSDADRVRKLTEKRIQRFFLRHVRRYIKLKKMVMSRRILRWWRRKFFRWRWREIAITTRERHRERASRVIQSAFKRFRIKKTFRELLDKHALRKVKLFLRSWLMARVIRKEWVRVEIFTLAASIGVTGDELVSHPDAPVDHILFALGMGLYTSGDFWNAACILEQTWKLNQATVTWEGRLALAYSHHMTWYSSYDAFNLTRAYETYSEALKTFFQQRTEARNELAEIDPFLLQDTAVVMMQMENFNGSLRMLARLIELFTNHESFSLWLLLAAVQLQQRSEWAQSVEYLTYIQDMPPSPYLERDILCLCAIGLERQKNDSASRTAGREAWKAAIRQWSLAQKELHAFKGERNAAWSQPSGEEVDRSRTTQSTRRKWEILNEFAQRAVTQGHYLLACRLMLYMLNFSAAADDESEANSDSECGQRASIWWNLGDIFRHLGHLDLYVNAAQRSHLCVETPDSPSNGKVDHERDTNWLREAETQSHSFQSDSEKLSIVDLVRKVHAQYSEADRF